MAWKDTAVEKAIILNLMIKKMAKNKDNIPTQLVEPVNNISMISSDIEPLKANHKALVHQASGLVIVLWRLYSNDRYPSIWPPPRLNPTVDKFVKTVDKICKLLARKCERKFLKKKMFVVLDLGKVKKYLRELDATATNIEGDPRARRVDLNAVLLEAVNECDNSQDEEAQILEAIVPEPVIEVVEAIEEDHEVETSTQTSRETPTSQSSSPSPQNINASFNNTGSVEEHHEAETSTWALRETPTSQSSSPSPHWQHFNTSINNTSSGVMINRNVGNTYKTTFTNVGNNNSVNHYYRCRGQGR